MAVVEQGPDRVSLEIEGMTCASCAVRIEKKLNRLDGVDATVNYATETAAVSFDPSRTSLDELRATVEAAGYHVAAPASRAAGGSRSSLGRRVTISAVLTAPLVALAMAPFLHFPGWEWVALGALDSGRALGRVALSSRCGAQRPARHGHDGHARLHWHPRRVGLVRRRAHRVARRRDVLRGRRRDHDADPRRVGSSRSARSGARARRSAPSSSWGRRTPPSCAAASRCACRWSSSGVGDVFVVRPGEKVATDGVVEEGRLGARPVDADRRAGAGRGRPGGRGRRRDDQHVREPRRACHEGRRRTRRSRRSPGSSPTRRRARRRSSVSSTASPASSCRS